MNEKKNTLMRRSLYVVLSLVVAACAAHPDARDARLKQQAATLQKQAEHLDTTERRIDYFQQRDKTAQQLVLEGYRHLYHKDYAKAESIFTTALSLTPDYAEARRGLDLIGSFRASDAFAEQALRLKPGAPAAALEAAQNALRLNPRNREAQALRQTLLTDQALANRSVVKLTEALTTPVSLALKDVSVVNALELLSQSSGINFVLDKDVRPDVKTTIFVKDAAIKDVLALIFKTTQLRGKPLNSSTYLIYPQAADKAKQYEDLVVKSYFLEGQNGKKLQEMIQSLVNPKFIYLDEPSSYITVRDTQEVINVVDRLVEVGDIIKPEVILEVEILEISSDKLKDIGLQFPSTVSGSLSPLQQTVNGFTGYRLNDLKNLREDSFRLGIADPALIANLKYQDGSAEILANPRIRVQNMEKAKVLLGDKVPVITTTTNQTSSAVTESISYLDVGLKLEATPIVHPSGDVTMDMELEVSNIVREVRSSTGLLTYQIGTRSTRTAMRARNGETQMLAGLIKNERRDSANRLPLLGQIPLFGKLFSRESSTRNKTEIVLLITPHIVRGQAVPPTHDAQFVSGSLEQASTDPFLLGETGQLQMGESATSLAPAAPDTMPPGPVLVDLDTRGQQLSLVAPESVSPNQEFVVTLNVDALLREGAQLDFRFDPARFEFVGATPVDANLALTLEQQAGMVRLRLEGAPLAQGPVAILAMKARPDFTDTGSLGISVAGVVDGQSTTSAPAPGKATISARQVSRP